MFRHHLIVSVRNGKSQDGSIKFRQDWPKESNRGVRQRERITATDINIVAVVNDDDHIARQASASISLKEKTYARGPKKVKQWAFFNI